jgi:hypothetical protein
MNYKKIIFLPIFLSSFFVLAETSSESAPSYKKTNSQQQMLLNRESLLLSKIEQLDLIKRNTQNPLLYKETIHDLEPLYKELEVIQKMQILLAQNNKNIIQASED